MTQKVKGYGFRIEAPRRYLAGYQYDTKYYRDRRPQPCAWAEPTPPYKRYTDPVARIALPEPVTKGGAGLWETIAARRSKRSYSGESLSHAGLSQLLWAIQGMTGERDGFRFRSAASAGALYLNETYVVINNVAGITPGIAHYEVRDHTLALIHAGGVGQQCAGACIVQNIAVDRGALAGNCSSGLFSRQV